jgi:hypothetical protein
MLADHLQAGRLLNGHDDVPETFCRLVLDDKKDREAMEERDERRKRRRRNLEGASSAPSICDRPERTWSGLMGYGSGS